MSCSDDRRLLSGTLPSSKLFSPPRETKGHELPRAVSSLQRALGLELAVGALGDLDQIEVLDRVAIAVELEVAAQGLEVGLPDRGPQLVLVGRAAGTLDRGVDQQGG